MNDLNALANDEVAYTSHEIAKKYLLLAFWFPNLFASWQIITFMRKQLTSLASFFKSFRGLNNLLRYNPLFYPKITDTIREINNTDATTRRQVVLPLLNTTLKAALQTPYGKGRNQNLPDWPILQKEAVRANPKHFETSHWPTVPAATSGSSGKPLRLKRGLKNIAAEQAFLDAILGDDYPTFRQARIAILRGDTVKDPADQQPPYGEYHHSRKLILSFPHLSEANAGWFIDELQKFQPDIFWVYPTGADFLASLCLQEGRKLTLPVILSSSEMLTPEAWSRMEAAFGGRVIDYYGQAERACLSYQYQPYEAWFCPAYGWVELFPDQEEIGENLRRAKIVATSYWEDKMPLVRYDTSDYIAYPAHYTEDDLSLVALGLKPFTRVIGRESEFLITPRGERIQALNNIPRDVKHLRRAQFIQHHTDRVEVRLDVEPAFGEAEQQELLASARTKIPPEVRITIVTDQPLEVTDSGKTPFVIRTVDH